MSVDRLAPALVHHVVNTLGWRSLRSLQAEAIAPLLAGEDAVLLAPTAGGKTEAAMFPLLTAMEQQRWGAPAVLYVCPLKALLNNLLPRLQAYGAWLGRRVEIWHGDVGAGARKRILLDPPDVLLTTPESLEAMLVGAAVDHDRFFADLRAVVVDEVHAFAGDDRGWHLLALLERLTRLCGYPLQRVGLSATVGNPSELLEWLQGAARGMRNGAVVAPSTGPVADIEVEVDYVGSVDNAATVLAALHHGEKRLVFCDSRALVEKLGSALRARGVTTFLSHASLSADERRQAETAFAEARDCVIVATSTLELGVDVGDLDRVVQINAPRTVASFLQRVGRTGRRPGTKRSCLFLALDEDAVLWAAGLLRLWGSGYVEPVTAPPEPRHIVAQQLLALCLQQGSVGSRLALDAWNGLPPFDHGAEPILAHLLTDGFVDRDGELIGIGPAAERRYGRRHFMEMTAVFTAPPQFRVFEGRREVGMVDPALLTDHVEGPRKLLLGGRSWRVTWIDWSRQRCYVEADDHGGRARWHTGGPTGASQALTRAVREVLLGHDPPVLLTERATKVLTQKRESERYTVRIDGTLILREGSELRWWTWAGFRANATLAATLSDLVDSNQRVGDVSIRLRNDVTREAWAARTPGAARRLYLPEIDDRALRGLKFADALPRELAAATLARRLADLDGAAMALTEPVWFGHI